jgi:hypothetical protein
MVLIAAFQRKLQNALPGSLSIRICANPMAAWVTCAALLGVARYQVIGWRA